MSVIIACFVGGALLLALEVILPGAVLGIVGGIALLAGVIASFSSYGLSGGALATLLMLLFLGLTIYLEFVWLPRSRLAKSLMVGTPQNVSSQPPLADATSVVGKQVRALTPLVPTGFVDLDGRRLEAFSRSGMIEAGATLSVVGVDNFRLIVSKN